MRLRCASAGALVIRIDAGDKVTTNVCGIAELPAAAGSLSEAHFGDSTPHSRHPVGLQPCSADLNSAAPRRIPSTPLIQWPGRLQSCATDGPPLSFRLPGNGPCSHIARVPVTPSPPTNASAPNAPPPGRVHFICNGVFTDAVGGGNVYFSQMARAAQQAGWTVHFIGGAALRRYLANDRLETEFTQLDSDDPGLTAAANTAEGFRLLWDFLKRTWRCCRRRHELIQPGEMAYAISEYWFDALPLFFCRARAKIMYLGMIAPTLRVSARTSSTRGTVFCRIARGRATGSSMAGFRRTGRWG